MKERKISQEKVKVVKNLTDLMNEKRTFLVASIRNIPALQYQEIVKKLRGKAVVKVPKKNLIFRVLDSSGNEEIKKIRERYEDSIAIIFSNLDSFDLAIELMESTTPSRAKAGQIADKDIEIEAGPTELLPGPAISELGDLGIQIQIEKGKITIKESKVVVKKGEKVSAKVAEILNKLDIKPFSVGFKPLLAYDSTDKKLYTEIVIDKKGTLEKLKGAYSKSLAFAVSRCYASANTISFLIAKAGVEGKLFEKLLLEKQEQKQLETKEETVEKSEEESNSEENKSENESKE